MRKHTLKLDKSDFFMFSIQLGVIYKRKFVIYMYNFLFALLSFVFTWFRKPSNDYKLGRAEEIQHDQSSILAGVRDAQDAIQKVDNLNDDDVMRKLYSEYKRD